MYTHGDVQLGGRGTYLTWDTPVAVWATCTVGAGQGDPADVKLLSIMPQWQGLPIPMYSKVSCAVLATAAGSHVAAWQQVKQPATGCAYVKERSRAHRCSRARLLSMIGSRGLSSWRSLTRSRGAGSTRRRGDASLLAGAARFVGRSTKATLQQRQPRLWLRPAAASMCSLHTVCLEQSTVISFHDAAAPSIALGAQQDAPHLMQVSGRAAPSPSGRPSDAMPAVTMQAHTLSPAHGGGGSPNTAPSHVTGPQRSSQTGAPRSAAGLCAASVPHATMPALTAHLAGRQWS